MPLDIISQQLIEFSVEPPTVRPHVVVLGAGASLAAFPTGDARGRQLPVMNNVVSVLGLEDAIVEAGFSANENFESVYSQLHSAAPNSKSLQTIEQRVMEYFGTLELPTHVTLYDMLLLSLREKDAIFTFNWDPFLVDAYDRNHGIAPLPHIFHLHGNVRVSFCSQCGIAMPMATACHKCGDDLTPTRLLYPIEQKDYASDPFISSQWQQARDFIADAGMITIFGYSAPKTDQEAIAIFTEAWKGDQPDKPVERVEIIDVRDSSELFGQWWDFAHHDHIEVRRTFYESMLARYPRRSCEALYQMGFEGHFVEHISWAGTLDGLQESVEPLIVHEG